MSEYGKKVAKKTSDYIGNIDSVDEEVRDIQHAVEGVNVRGALAAGVRKSFDISKGAEGKADEAHDVMESIMDEGFDNAALESNFEQKLDDKIDNLQPEWTEFQEDTKTQLAETDQQRFYESMVSRKKKLKPMITITDDDGNRGFYTVLYELAKEYNIPMTSAIITNRAMGFPDDSREYYNRYYHFDEIMEMKESGLVEFVSHMHHHDDRPSEMSVEELHQDLKTTREFMKKWGFNYRGVVYPYGAYNEKVLDVAKQYFDYSTGTGGGAHNDPGIVTPPTNNYRLGRFNLNVSFQENMGMIDRTVEENGWLIMIGHIDQQNATKQDYRNIIEYALKKGVEIVTLEEGHKTFGNIAQFGGTSMEPNTTISGDGVVHSLDLGNVLFDKSDTVDAYTHIDEFKREKITITQIKSSNMGGFPSRGATSAILKTYSIGTKENFWDYQEFTTTREKEMFIRYWDDKEDTWSDWVLTSPTQYLGQNTVLLDDKPTDNRLIGRISYSYINSGEKEPFPEGSSGWLTTNAFVDDTFAYQEYTIYQDTAKYIRWWKNDSEAWGDWGLVSGVRLPGLNAYDGGTLPGDFPIGITMFRLQSSHNDEGLPNDVGGTFVTYKVADSELSWNYQEFVEYGTTDKYIRTPKVSGDWSAWKKYVLETA